MKLLVFGSLNIDIVLQVDHFVSAGETLQARETKVFPGGKGLNQAVAAARAGSLVFMAGNVGSDGGFLIDLMKENEVDSTFVRQVEGSTGAAYIQVDPTGQNCIVLAPNANVNNSKAYIEQVLASFETGDTILLQNEINCLPELIELAHQKGMNIYLNPSPFNDSIIQSPLHLVSGFILNEVEGRQITGQTDPHQILKTMLQKYPSADVILTIGPKGALFMNQNLLIEQKAFDVKPVDTTAAGDTFTGYYLACLSTGMDQRSALQLASKAANIAITIQGATSSIPWMASVLQSTIQEMKDS